MKGPFETQLYGLTSTLGSIAAREADPEAKDAIRRAALALTYIFVNGQWAQWNEWHVDLGAPLTKEQRERLRDLGVLSHEDLP